MKYENIGIEEGLKKEWIITNGIGGYASTTIIGANTRRYHGLLIAPLTPPGQRNLILSKIDESVEIEGNKHDLYTNVGKDYISNGYKYLRFFEKEYIPVFTYLVESTLIKKYICLEYGKNTVVVLYRVFNGDKTAKLTLTPLLNFRDFHRDSFNHEFNIRQEEKDKKLKIVLDDKSTNPIYIKVSDGNYIKHENDSYKNMFYIEEEKRGLPSIEDHAIPGRFEVDIEPNEQKDITFVASLEENIEEIDGKEIINKEITRLTELTYDSGLENKITDSMIPKELIKGNKLDAKKLARDYMIAADNFVVFRPSFGLHTIIAGYPWFLDWGRDSLISFEGLLLKTKRYDIAKEVLLTMTKDVKYGLVPNGYSGYDNRPLYNSADASLLLFEEVMKYLRYTDDHEFVKHEIYPVLVKIIEAYSGKIDVDGNNIYLDDDGLISSGTEFIQNTWMDAKIGNFVVTPRNGKAVEINSMWYNALKIMEELSTKFDNKLSSVKYKKMADKAKKSFNDKFYNKRRKCLYDVLNDSKIRPNQLFALSLTFPVVDPKSEIAEDIINTVDKKLLNDYGIKTLAKGEVNYIEKYEGDAFKRDMSYHQGITWPWLLGLYYDSLKNMINAEKSKTKKEKLQLKLNDFVANVRKVFIKEFVEGKTIGGISEIYDSVKPYEAKGAFEQAWSISEIFRIILN